ncbi:hypothetical protein ACFV2X_06760 [Streptomyces sp. NPDC059679]|uniref:hypothetical protein n=1 Tax=Streptomyces sp. NPDC059679 TaxID=3346903 RepID=UPI0036800885
MTSRRPRVLPPLGAGAVIPPAAPVLAAAPWWAALPGSLPGGLALALQASLPRTSKDRLAWWRDRRRHREDLARSRAAQVRPLPPPANPTTGGAA